MKLFLDYISLMLLCAHLNTIVIFHVDGYDHDYDEGRQLKLIKAAMFEKLCV